MISKRAKAVAAAALVLSMAFSGARVASAQKVNPPRRGALTIASLRPPGDRNVAPPDFSNLTRTLREKLKFDVNISSKELSPQDPNLVRYPLIYLQGNAPLDFSEKDRASLRRHFDPGGATLFVDAACGSDAFDASFRRFVAELMPDHPLVPIPRRDSFYALKPGADLADTKRTAAAGGKVDFPDLEGVQVNGHWVIIYSRIDIGAAMQKQGDLDCKGYTHESALKIATNIVIYATLP
jgi:Domain of unknown function (DUF4159)